MIAAIKEKITLIIVAVIAFLLGFGIGFGGCYFLIKHTVQTEIKIGGLEQNKANTENALDKNQKSGDSHEAARRNIDHFYNKLKQEAANDAPDSADNYVLPDERLRRWRAANRGADSSAAANKPDTGTPAAAATGKRADTDAGKRPHGSGETVPPTGGADVRVASPDRD